ncbi:MAG: hypothetical protein L0Y72_02740 [Gemmataceae bacterium]|nr:hypothetical protein [Gemmataceae bacterium]MCI0737934.1 hypothetical protein [Gemmataceae bacterium]
MTGKLRVLVCGLVFCIGCGTMNSMGRDSQVFGGVRSDADVIVESVGNVVRPASAKEFADNAVIGLVASADVPLSAIADTVTLPVTVPAALERSKQTN